MSKKFGNNKNILNKKKMKYKINLLLVLFISLYQIINATKNGINNKRQLNSENYIKILVSGRGRIKICNAPLVHPENIPSEILYNGESINFTVTSEEIYINNDDEENKNLIVKWNDIIYDMSYMFYSCSSIISLDFSNFDTSFVTNMTAMFCECYSLKSISLKNYDTSSVEDMSYMFSSTKSLEALDLKSFNTSSVKNMRCMFCIFEFDIFQISAAIISFEIPEIFASYIFTEYYYFNSKFIYLNLTNFDTSSVSDMSNMFNGRFWLKSLDLGKFQGCNVEDMHSMFSFCFSLISVNISKFEAYNVRDMTSMFYGCTLLFSINLAKFYIKGVESLAYMFAGCKSITSLDLSNFDTSNVEYYFNMFNNCIKLEYLNIINFSAMIYSDNEDYFYEINPSIFYGITDNLIYCLNTSNPLSDLLSIELSS